MAISIDRQRFSSHIKCYAGFVDMAGGDVVISRALVLGQANVRVK